MQAIGTNSIRVYHVDPYASHDGCMSAFSEVGIYVWLDLDTFNTTVEQSDPQWTQDQFLAFAEVMDVFQQYDNLAGFWIGNEVINTADGSPAAPYVKAATADMKSYMAAKKHRQIPIGYSAADIAELRPMLQNYLSCGDNPHQIIDFFGLNSYEWCGAATYDSSGYRNLQAIAEGYNIPIFFSETGCNVGGERTFNDQAAIFGPDMVNTWSGSIIYEWAQEANDYGLANYPNGQIYSGAPTPIQPDYGNLANQWKTISPSSIAEANYSPSNSPPACPMATLGWQINGDVPLPTLGSAIIAAAAVTIKPTPTPTPTTRSSSLPATTSSPSGTVSTSYTAMSLGLQLYPIFSSGPKQLKTTSTLTNPANLGIVANFPNPSTLLPSASASSSPISISSTSTSDPSSSTSSGSQVPSDTSTVSKSSAYTHGSNTSPTGTVHNDTAISPTSTSPTPSASTFHSAASTLNAYKIWHNIKNLGGHGGLIGLVVLITLLSVTTAAFL
jgi:hypothetical protein